MSDRRINLILNDMLPESQLAIEHYLRSQEMLGGGVLIVRGPTSRRTATEAIFCTDRWSEGIRAILM